MNECLFCDNTYVLIVKDKYYNRTISCLKCCPLIHLSEKDIVYWFIRFDLRILISNFIKKEQY